MLLIKIYEWLTLFFLKRRTNRKHVIRFSFLGGAKAYLVKSQGEISLSEFGKKLENEGFQSLNRNNLLILWSQHPKKVQHAGKIITFNKNRDYCDSLKPKEFDANYKMIKVSEPATDYWALVTFRKKSKT